MNIGKVLFADYDTQENHAAKEIIGHRGVKAVNSDNPGTKRGRLDIFIEQIINASIVGGCAGFSALAADVGEGWKVALYAFGMTFFFELRKYRKL